MTLPVTKTVTSKKLTEKQDKLLNIFFKSKGKKPLKECAIEAGYKPEGTSVAIRALKDEILELTEMMLVEATPQAVVQIVSMLDNDEHIKNASVKLDAAKTILDRTGLGKKDKLEVDTKVSGGIFILPTKGNVIDAEAAEVVDE